MSIRREIEVTRKGLSRPIDVTYGTNILPIEFMITDFELPEGATAEVYAMGRSNKLVKQSCVISKNIISFIPEIGLFEEGKNVLQLAATYAGKDLFSFYIPVNCQKTMVYEGAQDLENDPTFVAIVMQMKEDIANKITMPEAAEVGQILEVEEVDENGKPTKFIAVDKPTGSGEGGAGAVELTQAEYDNLSEEEKNADVIYFITDGASEEEYDFDNAGSHNCVYRGKFLGNAVTSEQYARISDGTFKGMYIGDYWKINGVNYRIACFDYYMNCGDTPTTEHHVTIVPDTALGKAQMNSSASNSSGYATSSMFTTGLNGAKETVRNAFGEEHILTQRHVLINQVQNGYPYNYDYYDVDLILMTEANLYGCKMFSPTSTGTVAYNYCYDTNQFPLFAFNRSMIATGEQYWLRDTVSSSAFAAVSAKGQSAYYEANSMNSTIRPSFNIKG